MTTDHVTAAKTNADDADRLLKAGDTEYADHYARVSTAHGTAALADTLQGFLDMARAGELTVRLEMPVYSGPVRADEKDRAEGLPRPSRRQ